jgi:uncharacterized protein
VDATRPVETWKLVALGVVAGIFGGGLGLGGGFIMVPLLVLIGFGTHRAHATSLAAIVLIAVAGSISFGASGEIDVLAGVTIGIGGVAGSALGASVMNRVSAKALSITFLVIISLVSLRMIIGAEPVPGTAGATGFWLVALSMSIGVLAGFIAGLTGVGGGMVIVPAAVLLLGMSQHQAQGTSLVAIVLTAMSGTLVNKRNSRVRLRDGLVIGAGGVVGSVTGTRLALAIDAPTLTRVFGAAMLLIAARNAYMMLMAQPS